MKNHVSTRVHGSRKKHKESKDSSTTVTLYIKRDGLSLKPRNDYIHTYSIYTYTYNI